MIEIDHVSQVFKRPHAKTISPCGYFADNRGRRFRLDPGPIRLRKSTLLISSAASFVRLKEPPR